jgi:hypothetical protein
VGVKYISFKYDMRDMTHAVKVITSRLRIVVWVWGVGIERLSDEKSEGYGLF